MSWKWWKKPTGKKASQGRKAFHGSGRRISAGFESLGERLMLSGVTPTYSYLDSSATMLNAGQTLPSPTTFTEIRAARLPTAPRP
jgi:hypothetical protein